MTSATEEKKEYYFSHLLHGPGVGSSMLPGYWLAKAEKMEKKGKMVLTYLSQIVLTCECGRVAHHNRFRHENLQIFETKGYLRGGGERANCALVSGEWLLASHASFLFDGLLQLNSYFQLICGGCEHSFERIAVACCAEVGRDR